MPSPSRRTWVWLLAGGLVVALVAAPGATTATPAAEDPTISLYASPTAEFDDATEIAGAVDDGRLDPADELVVGGSLVVAVQSDRLASTLSARQGTTTQRFFEALDEDVYFGFVQQNAEPNVRRKTLEATPNSTRVYRDGARTYIVLDTDRARVGRFPPWERSASDTTVYGGDQFAPVVGFDTTDLSTGPTVTLYDTPATLLDTPDVVTPAQVTGTVQTSVPPEENLTLRTTVGNGSTETTQLPTNSSVATYSLDFRTVSSGTSFTLELVHDGAVVDRHEGTVRTPRATLRDASVQGVADSDVTPRVTLTARLSHGGTVVVQDGFGARLGSTTVPAGTSTSLSVGLRLPEDEAFDPDELRVVAVRDADGVTRQYPGPNASLGLDVSEYEWGADDWQPDTGTAGSEATSPTEDTTDDRPTAGPEAPTVGTETDGSAAGFGTTAGVVGLVVVLCSTGFLLRRRLGGT